MGETSVTALIKSKEPGGLGVNTWKLERELALALVVAYWALLGPKSGGQLHWPVAQIPIAYLQSQLSRHH